MFPNPGAVVLRAGNSRSRNWGVGWAGAPTVGWVRGMWGVVEGVELMCMVVMCRTVEVPLGVGVFLVTTCNPFLKKKRCFRTRGRGLFSFRLDQPFGGSWGWSLGVSLGGRWFQVQPCCCSCSVCVAPLQKPDQSLPEKKKIKKGI